MKVALPPLKKIHTWNPHKKTNKKRKRSIVRKSREDENGDANKLCESVIYSIFIRCPVKTLAMVRCASKTWNDLIASPFFLHTHLEQSTENAQLLFLKVTRPYSLRLKACQLHFVLVNMDGKGESNELYSVTIPQYYLCCGMIVCAGLVCLSAEPLIYLCNPVMKQFCKLPNGSPTAFSSGINNFGFGYLRSTKEYKVVRFFYRRRDSKLRCEVFTLNGAAGGNRWKEIAETPPSHPRGPGVLVNECLYWMATELPLRKPDRILSFELENEKFLTISRPSSFDPILIHMAMMDLNGMLCLPDMGHFRRTLILDLWILEDKISCLWVKGYNIKIELPISILPHFRTWNGDEIIFVNDGMVVFYDLKANRYRTRISLEEIGFPIHTWELDRIGFSFYRKSLFSLY